MGKLLAFLLGLLLGVHAGAVLYVWARQIVIDAAVAEFARELDQ